MKRDINRRLRILCTGAAVILGTLLSHAASAEAGSFRTPIVIMNDTTAVGFMDSTAVIDMTTDDELTLRVKVWPPAGAAEPWAVMRLRAIGSMSWPPDTNSTGIVPLTIVADHSYVGSAAGDSLAYGAWTTGNSVAIGNGEILYRGARFNSKWAYPSAEFLTLTLKGQNPRVRFVYLQVSAVTSGGGGVPRTRITAIKWVK